MKEDTRRTLKFIEQYPTPAQIYHDIIGSEGWGYKTNKDFYLKRDRALLSLLYVLALRISEALRLTQEQFIIGERKDRLDSCIQ